MERLKKKYISFQNALETLEKTLTRIINKEYNDYEECRDSFIQRFEYCSDIFWKLLRIYSEDKTGKRVEIARPKTTYRECLDTKVISQDELEVLLRMVEDRNQTSHTYEADLAEEIAERIPGYFKAMKNIFQRLDI